MYSTNIGDASSQYFHSLLLVLISVKCSSRLIRLMPSILGTSIARFKELPWYILVGIERIHNTLTSHD